MTILAEAARERALSQKKNDTSALPGQAEPGFRVLLDGAARYQEKQALIESLATQAELAEVGGDLTALKAAAYRYRNWQQQQRLAGRGQTRP